MIPIETLERIIKDNMFIQAGIAVMVLSNQLTQDALKVLENVRSI